MEIYRNEVDIEADYDKIIEGNPDLKRKISPKGKGMYSRKPEFKKIVKEKLIEKIINERRLPQKP